MVRSVVVACAMLTVAGARSPHWTVQTSGVTARLRGISAVNERVAWASGANGTILRTADRGQSWQRQSIPDTENHPCWRSTLLVGSGRPDRIRHLDG